MMILRNKWVWKELWLMSRRKQRCWKLFEENKTSVDNIRISFSEENLSFTTNSSYTFDLSSWLSHLGPECSDGSREPYKGSSRLNDDFFGHEKTQKILRFNTKKCPKSSEHFLDARTYSKHCKLHSRQGEYCDTRMGAASALEQLVDTHFWFVAEQPGHKVDIRRTQV